MTDTVPRNITAVARLADVVCNGVGDDVVGGKIVGDNVVGDVVGDAVGARGAALGATAHAWTDRDGSLAKPEDP